MSSTELHAQVRRMPSLSLWRQRKRSTLFADDKDSVNGDAGDAKPRIEVTTSSAHELRENLPYSHSDARQRTSNARFGVTTIIWTSNRGNATNTLSSISGFVSTVAGSESGESTQSPPSADLHRRFTRHSLWNKIGGRISWNSQEQVRPRNRLRKSATVSQLREAKSKDGAALVQLPGEMNNNLSRDERLCNDSETRLGKCDDYAHHFCLDSGWDRVSSPCSSCQEVSSICVN